VKVDVTYEKAPVESVILTLTREEALLLGRFIGLVGGNPFSPLRRLLTPIWNRFHDVFGTELTDSNLPFRLRNSIRVE
jgi:hypothetical protein